MMRIFIIHRKKVPRDKQKRTGFSILEILIVLAISAMVLGLVLSVGIDIGSPRKNLEETIRRIEQAIRFGMDEAILRNTVIRMRLILDKSPQEFVLEFGPNEHFVLPKEFFNIENADDLNKREQKEQQNLVQKINKKFSRIKEFQDNNEILPEDVRIVGAATTSLNKLIFGPEVSFFIYPSGEKDGAIIIFGTQEELGVLNIEEFSLDFETEFFKNEEQGLDFESEALQDMQFEKAKEIFDRWE